MKRISVCALICILITVCVLSCALPSRSAINTDHDCTGEICLVCLISALSSDVLGNLLLLSVSGFFTLFLYYDVLPLHTIMGNTPKNTPVCLKVKLLN